MMQGHTHFELHSLMSVMSDMGEGLASGCFLFRILQGIFGTIVDSPSSPIPDTSCKLISVPLLYFQNLLRRNSQHSPVPSNQNPGGQINGL